MGTGFVEFLQLREVGVFSYLVISCLNAMKMVFGSYETGMAEHFSPKKRGLHAGSGDCPWAVHGWTWDCVAQSRKLLWTEKVHEKNFLMLLWKIRKMVEIPGPVLDSPLLISN